MIAINIPDLPDRTQQPDYCQTHVDCKFTTGQATATRLLLERLTAAHAQLLGGRHVESAADAVRWLIEQVGVAYNLSDDGVVQ